MPVIKKNVAFLERAFLKSEVEEIVRLAKRIDQEEAVWRGKLRDLYRRISEKVSISIQTTGRIPSNLDEFDEFFLLHALQIQGFTLKDLRVSTLAGPPKGKTPKSLADLRYWYDLYQTKKKLPPRVKKIADGIKKAYIKKCQSVWQREAEPLIQGEVYSSEAATRVVQTAAKTTYARAKMIVETETTYYQNKVRKDVYDKSPDVTHYLFMAIRDFRTTKWCKTRHGLVYQKDDPLFEKECPPAHYNCRSEILPLSELNPRHKALIDDPKNLRRNHSCEPLPKGWNRS